MLILLGAAGGFVFWRVQVALDHRLNEDLASRTSDLRQAALHLPPHAALASLRDEARDSQLLGADGSVLAAGSAITGASPLLTAAQARRASDDALKTGRGYFFSKRGKHLRILALPVGVPGRPAVAVAAIRLDQRDEALRELLAQLGIANLVALAIASLVGYRFAHAALDPVERYRVQAEEIARGATGVRLDIPVGPNDEVVRLGVTLNAMLEALERSAARQQEFIDDASHELRTPLATLSAEIDVALRKPRTAEEYEATLRRLAEDAGAIRSLAETLLTLGALGSTTPNRNHVSVETLLDRAARRIRSQLEPDSYRGVEVRSSVTNVWGDERLLERALGNIADNALHHGRGTMTLFSEQLADAVAVIGIHDEGHIDPQFLPSAAERFRQDETSRTSGGAGLGLSLVDAVADAHEGQLRLCSDGHHHHRRDSQAHLDEILCRHPDEGTTVALLIPTSDARI